MQMRLECSGEGEHVQEGRVKEALVNMNARNGLLGPALFLVPSPGACCPPPPLAVYFL